MRKLGFLALVMVMALGVGCSVVKIDSTVTPPSEHAVVNSRTFNAPYDKVWKATITSIGESFFVLENIEKDSGILSLSFSVKKPNDYIDCGSISESGNLNLREKYSNFFLGAETPVKRFVEFNGQAVPCYREIFLSGKSNIIVERTGKNSTNVKVNTRYIVDLVNNVTYFVPINAYRGVHRTEAVKNQMAFTSHEIGSFSNYETGLKCRSRFTLEQQILDAIEAKL